MENNIYEQEIDLKDLLFHVLRKWRMIIIIALLFAVLLGGYKLVINLKQQSDIEYMDKTLSDYEIDLQTYKLEKKGLDRELESLMSNIKTQEEYMENSIVMEISPYKKYVASADIFVKTDYQVMPDKVFQNTDYTGSLISAYTLAVEGGGGIDKIAPGYNIDAFYLKELVSIKSSYNNEQTDSILHVEVSYSDEKKAVQIRDQITQYIYSLQPDYEIKIGKHSLETLNETAMVKVDLGLLELQKKNSDDLMLLRTNLSEKQKTAKSLSEPIPPSISKSSALKNGIKYGILGGVLGAFGVIFFVSIGFLMSDTVLSEKELKKRFALKQLGIFHQSRNKGLFSNIDIWLDKMQGIHTDLSENAVYDIVSANIINYSEGNLRVLVTGMADSEKLREVAERMKLELPQIKFVVGDYMINHAETLKEMPNCDAVILVEQRGGSKYSGIIQELEAAKNNDNSIIGFILI